MTVFGAVMYFLAVWLLAICRFYAPSYRIGERRTSWADLPILCCGPFQLCGRCRSTLLGLSFSWSQPFPRHSVDRWAYLWADGPLPSTTAGRTLLVHSQIAWWFAAAIFGGWYIAVIGRAGSATFTPMLPLRG